MPEAIPFNGTCTATLETMGYAFDEERTYCVTLEGEGMNLTLTQHDAETNEPMLTVHAALSDTENLCSYFTVQYLTEGDDVVDMMSINDSRLNDLVERVKDTFTERLLPILAAIPASTYNTLFTFLDETGILDMLMPEVG